MLSPSLFHLQADYNVIKRIDSGALRFLYKLRVLILNDNLIPALPAHLFRLHPDFCCRSFKLLYAATDLEKFHCQTQLSSFWHSRIMYLRHTVSYHKGEISAKIKSRFSSAVGL